MNVLDNLSHSLMCVVGVKYPNESEWKLGRVRIMLQTPLLLVPLESTNSIYCPHRLLFHCQFQYCLWNILINERWDHNISSNDSKGKTSIIVAYFQYCKRRQSPAFVIFFFVLLFITLSTLHWKTIMNKEKEWAELIQNVDIAT